jgi:aspartyl-tRNA(Asn)/glutamyl-tRNA(Gln) amidotransferase subunit A
MIDLKNLTIEKAHESMKSGQYSSRELTQAYLDVIAEKNKDIFAFIEVFDDALMQADKADEMFKSGKATMLTGIPFATKDNILIEGKHASASSKILENHIASYDATVIKILKNEGAVFIGRTNMDEFAMGSSTQTSAFAITKNPYDLTRVPGGSSGGSAAAVSAGMTLVALGTETCGSVRQPAALCGLVGLKPTYGALSRSGLIAMGNSLDQPAPFTRTVRESEIIFNALAKYDPMDSTSVPENLRHTSPRASGRPSPTSGEGKMRIGIPRSFFAKGLDKEVEKNFNEWVEKLKNAGYEIVDLEMPDLEYSLAVYYIIMPAEVSTNLARFDGIKYGLSLPGKDLMEVYTKSRGQGFGKEVRRRILLGTYVLSHGYADAYYNKAVLLRDKISKEIAKAFESVDLIATPTVPTPAFKLGEKLDDPVAMYLCDIFSAPANLAGIPSIALPSGMTEGGLPMSFQFMAPHFCEDMLFEVGKAFENLR